MLCYDSTNYVVSQTVNNGDVIEADRYILNLDEDNTSNTQFNKIPNVVLGVGGNSRTNWSNFGKMADALRRDREHFIKYVTSDLSVEASLGTEDQLYLKSKQRITEAMLKNVVQKYCDAFVKCPNCNSYKTLLKKDQSTRLPQIYCEVCKGTKTIQNIKSRGGGGGKKK